MRVRELWRYPVKSLGGEQCEQLEVDRRGPVADRLWAVVDADGKLGSGKNTRRFRRIDGLLDCRAWLDGETAVVVLPDGREVRVDAPDADRLLRTTLGRADVRLARETTVMHHDAAPLHVLTTASMRALAEWVDTGADTVDVRRFRPNVVIDTGDVGAFVEDAWVGRRATIGEVAVEFTKLTERCVMVDADQPGLEPSRHVLKAISVAHDLDLGAYATVVRPGVIRGGDTVRLG